MAAAFQPNDGFTKTPAQILVEQAGKKGQLDHLLRRFAGLSTHYPPSEAIIVRFANSDSELRDRAYKCILGILLESEQFRVRTLDDAVRTLNDARLVRDTITLLITDQLYGIVFEGSGYLRYEMVKFAAGMGYALEAMANFTNLSKEQCFLVGVTSTLGIPVLASAQESKYGGVLGQLPGGSVRLEDAETASFGLNHLAISAAISQIYEFPDWVQRALDPNVIPGPIQKGLELSRRILLSQRIDRGLSTIAPALTEKDLDLVGLTPELLESLVDSVLHGVSTFQQVVYSDQE